MRHFWFASKQVFYFTGLLPATHAALYDLRTLEGFKKKNTSHHHSDDEWT